MAWALDHFDSSSKSGWSGSLAVYYIYIICVLLKKEIKWRYRRTSLIQIQVYTCHLGTIFLLNNCWNGQNRWIFLTSNSHRSKQNWIMPYLISSTGEEQMLKDRPIIQWQFYYVLWGFPSLRWYTTILPGFSSVNLFTRTWEYVIMNLSTLILVYIWKCACLVWLGNQCSSLKHCWYWYEEK